MECDLGGCGTDFDFLKDPLVSGLVREDLNQGLTVLGFDSFNYANYGSPGIASSRYCVKSHAAQNLVYTVSALIDLLVKSHSLFGGHG